MRKNRYKYLQYIVMLFSKQLSWFLKQHQEKHHFGQIRRSIECCFGLPLLFTTKSNEC